MPFYTKRGQHPNKRHIQFRDTDGTFIGKNLLADMDLVIFIQMFIIFQPPLQ